MNEGYFFTRKDGKIIFVPYIREISSRLEGIDDKGVKHYELTSVDKRTNEEEGYITYVEDTNGEIHIESMQVNKDKRRQNIATQMLRQLQKDVGDREIYFDSLTDDGKALLEKTAFMEQYKSGPYDVPYYKGTIPTTDGEVVTVNNEEIFVPQGQTFSQAVEAKSKQPEENKIIFDNREIDIKEGETPLEAEARYKKELPNREDIKASLQYREDVPNYGEIFTSDELSNLPKTDNVVYNLPENIDKNKKYYIDDIKYREGKYNVYVNEIEDEKLIHHQEPSWRGNDEPFDYYYVSDGYDNKYDNIMNNRLYNRVLDKNLVDQLDVLSKYDYDTIKRLAKDKHDITTTQGKYTYNITPIDTNLPEAELRYKLAAYYAWNERDNSYVSSVSDFEVRPNKPGAYKKLYEGGQWKKDLTLTDNDPANSFYFETPNGEKITMLNNKEYKQLTTDFANKLIADEDAHGWVQSYIDAFGTAYSDDLNRYLSNQPIGKDVKGSRVLINYDKDNLLTGREYTDKLNELVDYYNKNKMFPSEYSSSDLSSRLKKSKDEWNSETHQYNTEYKHVEHYSDKQIKDAQEITTMSKELDNLRRDAYKKETQFKKENPGADYQKIKEYREKVENENGYTALYEKYKNKDNQFLKDYGYESWDRPEYNQIANYDVKHTIFSEYEDKAKHNLKWMTYKEAYDGLSNNTINKDIQQFESDTWGVKPNLNLLERGHKAFDNVFDKYGVTSDHDIIVYRRTALDDDVIKEGFTQFGLMSTSARDTLPQKMPSGVSLGDNSMYIIIPKGQKFLPVEKSYVYDASDPDEVSNARRLARQHEIILPMGTHLEWTGDTKDGVYIMEVTKGANYYGKN